MPIVNSVYNVLFGELTPKEAVAKLMTRGAKFEDQNKIKDNVNNSIYKKAAKFVGASIARLFL